MGRGGWGRVRDGQRELGGVGEEHGVPCTTIVLRSASEKLYIIEYTSGSSTKNWSQGNCIHTALNTCYALSRS